MDPLLQTKLGEEDAKKLEAIKNPEVHRFISKYVKICDPESIFVSTGSEDDMNFIRSEALRLGEEKELATPGHTVHFDGYYDQARDRKNTKYLLPEGVRIGRHVNAIERDEGLREIHELMRGIMRGHRLYVLFFCLGPVDSKYRIPCIQLTDSSYVAHTENLLYRGGYKLFLEMGDSNGFFKFVHSSGELVNGVSKNLDKRRIYIDLEGKTVFSINTQYGGNTIGLKKLAMRLAIHKASKEGWLVEHMFIMGVHGPNGRVTYFTGAFPSLCGKTSTCMLTGESIIGDDIAFLWRRDGKVWSVNTEKGIFGVIEGINPRDDQVLWRTLHKPAEIIFSNVLVTEDGKVYWVGMNGDPPPRGTNYSGEWFPGKRDSEGKPIPPSHKNARFAIALKDVENVDPRLDDPMGVEVGGIIYGGRDSDTSVPVEESFNWIHGVVTKGASLESEATAAVLGDEGIREFNPMANIDFLSIPLGDYIQNYIEFGKDLKKPPLIFSVNYFLRDENGNFLTSKMDKAVWLKWMELRVHRDTGALRTPTGFIPRYEDLQRLFKEVLKREYSRKSYIKQFTLRIPQNLAKIERIEKIYKTVPNTPRLLFRVLSDQKRRLMEAKSRYGDYVSPECFV